MPRVAYVHVGYHKTGTTALQLLLSRHREQLLERGFLYPKFGTEAQGLFGHHAIAWALLNRPGFVPNFGGYSAANRLSVDELRRLLHEELAQHPDKDLIISSEEFDCFARDEIGELRSLLADYELVFIVALRPWNEFMESSFQTAVIHTEEARSIDEFVKRQRARLDVTAFANDLSGFGEVRLVSYSRRVVSDILGLIGLDSSDFSDVDASANVSWPPWKTHLLSAMRRAGTGVVGLRNIAGMLEKVHLRPLDRYGCLSAELQAELFQKFVDDVRRLKERGFSLEQATEFEFDERPESRLEIIIGSLLERLSDAERGSDG